MKGVDGCLGERLRLCIVCVGVMCFYLIKVGILFRFCVCIFLSMYVIIRWCSAILELCTSENELF